MSEEDISKYKTEEHINYITIPEGRYKGVSYRINDSSFIEQDGKNYVKLDYDVNGLDDEDSVEFESFLGDLVVKAIEFAIEKDKRKNGQD